MNERPILIDEQMQSVNVRTWRAVGPESSKQLRE